LTSPEAWARKLLRDRDYLLNEAVDNGEQRAKLKVKIKKEIALWFEKLEDESTWELSDHGKIYWHWQKIDSNLSEQKTLGI